MSTSAVEAKNDLAAQLPSCSHELPLNTEDDHEINNAPLLFDDLLEEIFTRSARRGSIRTQMRLRRVNSLAYDVVQRLMSKEEELLVEILEPNEYRFIGLRREKLAVPEPNIIVQGSLVHSMEEALFLVRAAISSMKVLKSLRLYSKETDSAQSCFIAVIEEVLDKENVKLDTIKFRRRRVGGGALEAIVKLITKHASTLRSIGQLGLSEALGCFAEKEMELERLSLNAFDHGFDADPESICDKMVQLMLTKVKTKHLSYASLEGFDFTDQVVQRLLASLECSSVRLTMVKGPYIPPQPDYMIGKIRLVEKLEMVEVVEKTNIFNTLVTYEKYLKKVFPNVEDINYLQDWRRV